MQCEETRCNCLLLQLRCGKALQHQGRAATHAQGSPACAAKSQQQAGICPCMHSEALQPGSSSCLKRPEHDAGRKPSAHHGAAAVKAPWGLLSQ